MDQVQNLPINAVRDELLELIQNNPVVIVTGETGSGKSTQIPKILLTAGYVQNGKCIAVTQPRRVAVKSLAERVSKEMGTEIGKTVGYAMRFVQCISSETVIKYFTDGYLIREGTRDPNLNQYSVVIIDEAHERSINSDLACGLLKKICKVRPDFRVIINSASLEDCTLSTYFDNAPVFHIPGRAFPVEILYEPKPADAHVDEVSDLVIKICQTDSQGNILVFLTDRDEIAAVQANLEGRLSSVKGSLTPQILQCRTSLPFLEQEKLFEQTSPECRKIILATSVAETALYFEDIDVVLDCGFFQQSHFDLDTKMEILLKRKITKFQASQRAGRAGRTRPGKCYRFYSEKDLESFEAAPMPEILRCNLNCYILDLIAMGFENPLEFDFITPPPVDTLKNSMSYLQELSALDKLGNITSVGKLMATFPVKPQLAKILVSSMETVCVDEITKTAALLCIYSKLYEHFYKLPKL